MTGHHPIETLLATSPNHHDYSSLLRGVRGSFEAAVTGHTHVFRTNARLWDAYLEYLSRELRQEHNCHACRSFIERFGGLVAVEDDGRLTPVMWDPSFVGWPYKEVFAALRRRVQRARIVGVHLSELPTWGTPATGAWEHPSVRPPERFVHPPNGLVALTAHQRAAAVAENVLNVHTALGEMGPHVLDEALRVIEALPRAEHFRAPIQWLRALHDRPPGVRGDNAVWRAVAAAPEGYCHPRSSVVWPLIDDILAGASFSALQAKWRARVDPINYQRPKAAPAAGNIEAAERLVERMGIARSLERRYATVDEVLQYAEWAPADIYREVADRVFGHLTPKRRRTLTGGVILPSQTMTWVKFADRVLPAAEELEVLTPVDNGPYIALTTAEHDDAPPLFKWDHPFACYVYRNGSEARQWGLRQHTWTRVRGITPMPNSFDVEQEHLGRGRIILLAGCGDSRNPGLALFPEALRQELFAVRSTIEAHSRTGRLGRPDGWLASGLDIGPGQPIGLDFKALQGGRWTEYRVDRWD